MSSYWLKDEGAFITRNACLTICLWKVGLCKYYQDTWNTNTDNKVRNFKVYTKIINVIFKRKKLDVVKAKTTNLELLITVDSIWRHNRKFGMHYPLCFIVGFFHLARVICLVSHILFLRVLIYFYDLELKNKEFILGPSSSLHFPLLKYFLSRLDTFWQKLHHVVKTIVATYAVVIQVHVFDHARWDFFFNSTLYICTNNISL